MLVFLTYIDDDDDVISFPSVRPILFLHVLFY